MSPNLVTIGGMVNTTTFTVLTGMLMAGVLALQLYDPSKIPLNTSCVAFSEPATITTEIMLSQLGYTEGGYRVDGCKQKIVTASHGTIVREFGRGSEECLKIDEQHVVATGYRAICDNPSSPIEIYSFK